MANFQSKTLGEMRRSVGKNLGVVIDGTTTSTTDTTSIISTSDLFGGDDQHNQKSVKIYETTDGNAPQGETRVVSDYAGSTQDATTSAFSAAVTSGDKFEMWERPWVPGDIDDAINQVLMQMTGRCPQIKEDKTLFTEANKTLYTIPSGFVSLSNVSCEGSVAVYEDLDDCDTAWTAGTNATVTVDSTVEREGSYCVKIVIGDAASTTEIIAYDAITSTDISNCDRLEFSMYSTIALTAGQLQFHLDNTAAIASALETLDIPAMSANTWYRHSIALANPISDTAIISIGLYQVADVGACTVFIDKVRAVNSMTKKWVNLPKEYWKIVRGSTNYIQFSKYLIPNRQLRLLGYQNLTLLSADSSSCEIEPGWVIKRATAELLINHAKSPSIDIDDKRGLSDRLFAQTEASMGTVTTKLMQGTEVI